MRPNPDNRDDNVEKIQNNINSTIKNISEAEETLARPENKTNRGEIEAKNERRRQALEAMRREIRDEAAAMEQRHETE